MITPVVVLDFETASACDLLVAGADRYAQDPTTEVLCASFSVFFANDAAHARRRRWLPGGGDRELRSLAEDPDSVFIAHGAGFEQAIWREIMVPVYRFPPLPPARWHDTMATCAMKGLPLGLDEAARVLKLEHQKDMAASRLTRSLSRPVKKTGTYDRSPETLERVYAYCDQDVAAELDLLRRVGKLTRPEREVWLLDQAINQRGVYLDQRYIRCALRIVEQAKAPLAAEFSRLTGLNVGQRGKIKSWVAAAGLDLPNLQKETLTKILGAGLDEDPDDIEDDGAEPPIHGDELLAKLPQVHRALTIRRVLGSSSIKKLSRMVAVTCADGRARGLLQYHGAAPGRWAGRLLQPQNFPRPTLTFEDKPVDRDDIVNAILTGDAGMVSLLVGEPIETVISGLRHAITAAPGHVLVAGDYAGIQARSVLAVAGQWDKVELMASGGPVYEDMAAAIFGHPVNKKDHPEERQVGKNTVLGCGFQMAAKTFRAKYCRDKPLEFAEGVIRAYRKVWAPKVPKLWYALEDAAVTCVWTRRPTEAYGMEFRIKGEWLTMRLPSGRRIWYHSPAEETVQAPWDPAVLKRGFSYRAWKNGRWVERYAFGGELTQNAICGMEADLLRRAIKLAEANEMPVVMLTHDELVCEPDERKSDAETVLTQIMLDVDQWVRDHRIPIAIESWTGARYRK